MLLELSCISFSFKPFWASLDNKYSGEFILCLVEKPKLKLCVETFSWFQFYPVLMIFIFLVF